MREAFVEIKGRTEHYGMTFHMKKTLNSIEPIDLGLAAKLKNKTYFNKFFRERARDETAMQIRDMRERRELTQAAFARLIGTRQSAVSRIQSPNYSGWTFTTLQRIAETLDARLVIRFEPREDVIANYERIFSRLSASRKATTTINGDTNG